jgi:hypothetical protein
VRSARAQWLESRHQPATADVTEGLRAADAALSIAPRHASGTFVRAALLIEAMRDHPGVDRARAALAGIEAAVALVPSTAGELARVAAEAEQLLGTGR